MKTKKFKVTRILGKAVYDLPIPMCREIGRITIRWAFFERYLKGIAWEFMGVDASLGRIAIRDPKPKQVLEMIRDIADLQAIELDQTVLKSLLERVEGVSSNRDLVTHGIWIPDHNGWNVQRTSGNWPKQKVTDDAPTGARRIYPEGLPISPSDLRVFWTDIESLIGLAKKLRVSARIKPPA